MSNSTLELLSRTEAGIIDAVRFRAREIKRPRIAHASVSAREGATFERHTNGCGGCEVCRPARAEDYEPERPILEGRAKRIARWKRAARKAAGSKSTTGKSARSRSTTAASS